MFCDTEYSLAFPCMVYKDVAFFLSTAFKAPPTPFHFSPLSKPFLFSLSRRTSQSSPWQHTVDVLSLRVGGTQAVL